MNKLVILSVSLLVSASMYADTTLNGVMGTTQGSRDLKLNEEVVYAIDQDRGIAIIAQLVEETAGDAAIRFTVATRQPDNSETRIPATVVHLGWRQPTPCIFRGDTGLIMEITLTAMPVDAGVVVDIQPAPVA